MTMRKQFFKTTMVCFLAATMMMSITGCGSDNVAIDEFENIKKESEQAKTSGKAELTKVDIDGIPEHVNSVLNEQGNRSLSLDADVVSKGYNEAPIYSMKPIEINDDYMISLAKKLFDNGKYTSQLPYKYWEQADLITEKQQFDDMEKEAEASGYRMDSLTKYSVENVLQQGEIKKKPAILDESNLLYEEEPAWEEFYGEYEKEQFCNLRGTINGKEYLLCYREVVGGNTNNMFSIKLKPLFPIALDAMQTSITNEEFKDKTNIDYEGKNPVDEEVAKSEAEQIIKKLGFENFMFAYSEQKSAYTNPETGETGLNGYYLTYKRDFNEINMDHTVSEMCIVGNQPDSKANPLERIMICISEDGLESMDIDVHYEVGDVLAENVAMLSFEQVNEAVEEMMKTVNPQSRDEPLYRTVVFDEKTPITQIRLCYMPAEYEGEYVYMPMWLFGFEEYNISNGSGEVEVPIFAVGAVDGKVYNFSLFGIIDMY